MKRIPLIAQSGPYIVRSLANGTMTIEPAWPQFPKWNAQDGGGPGVVSRMALATAIETKLNHGIRKRKVK